MYGTLTHPTCSIAAVRIDRLSLLPLPLPLVINRFVYVLV